MKFFLLFPILFSITCYSQNFYGSVTDQNNHQLSSVSITLHKKNQQSILAFCISDKEGKFKIEFSSTLLDTLEIKASLLGYSTQRFFFIPGQQTVFNFQLSPAPINLPEVKVKTPPVWQLKDTVNYSTSEFQRPQDRVIGDIISRLPGMEVSPGGQIKYNGKPINKYYIEGLDLLEDRYGIANNNIPADAVEKVQVLENHQPVKILDSLVYSDRAAINIKLKSKARMRLVGRARLGAGMSPLLAEAEASPMLFKKQFQFITTYKYNNTGINNKWEFSSQNFMDFINAMQNGAVKNDLLELVSPGQPPLSSQRYLFNNTHTATGNFLVPLNKTFQLRINTSYINDFQKQQSRSITKYYLPQDTVTVEEQNHFYSNENRLQTDLTLMANTKTFYLKNLLRFQGYWMGEGSKIVSVAVTDQQLRNPIFNVMNDFSLLKTGKKFIRSFGSYIGYVTLPQRLTILPGLYESILNNNLPIERLQQTATLQTQYTDNFISLRKLRSKISAAYKAGANWQQQQFMSLLHLNSAGTEKQAADSFQNHLNWQRLRIYAGGDWNYDNNQWGFSFALPVNYTIINYKDDLKRSGANRSAFLYSPSFNVMNQLSPFWSISSSLSYTKDYADVQSIAAGFILKNYRNFSNSNAPLMQYDMFNAAANIIYRNPLKVFFWSTGVSFSNTAYDLMYQQLFTGNLQTLTALNLHNTVNRVTVSTRISKYFIDIKTSVTANGIYSTGSQQQIQQGLPVTFNNKSYNASIELNTKLSSRFSVDYNGTYGQSFSKIQSRNSTGISTANQRLLANWIPQERIIITLTGDHFYQENNVFKTANYFFADGSIRYKFKKKKIDAEMAVQNLLNTRNFTTVMLSNNIEAVSSLQLRPRQCMLRVSFTF